LDSDASLGLYDNEAREGAEKHIVALRELMNGVFSRASSAGFALMSDAASTTSSGSSRTRVTAAERTRLASKRALGPNEIVQNGCLEDALASAYTQLFAVLHSLIRVEIRATDQKAVLDLHKALDLAEREYVAHLKHVGGVAQATLDVAAAQKADERLATLNLPGRNDLERVLVEVFRENVRKALVMFQNNCLEADDKANEDRNRAQTDMNANFERIERQKHLPPLMELEKRFLIEQKLEESRKLPIFADRENEIRGLIAAKRFEEAEERKRELDKLRVQKVKERRDQMQERHDKNVESLLTAQLKDLTQLELALQQRMEFIAKKNEDEKAIQVAELGSCVRATQQKYGSLAQKLFATSEMRAKSVTAPEKAKSARVKSGSMKMESARVKTGLGKVEVGPKKDLSAKFEEIAIEEVRALARELPTDQDVAAAVTVIEALRTRPNAKR
jgi:hypothetical protein